MKKKETTLSVLKNIEFYLKQIHDVVVKETVSTPKPTFDDSKYLKITFPSKTAKEIVDECNNKLGYGKLIYNTSWYEKEAFYTTEKTRPGTRYVAKELISLGSTWNECYPIEKSGNEMMNFAEAIFFIQEYFKQTGTYPWNYKWSWTSSHSSDGDLVIVGRGLSDGVDVESYGPWYSNDYLGVCFQKNI